MQNWLKPALFASVFTSLQSSCWCTTAPFKSEERRKSATCGDRGGEQGVEMQIMPECLTHTHHQHCTQLLVWTLHATLQWLTVCSACERSKVTLLTSKVISRTFLGICMMPESPSSPDTHTQGLEVVMALLRFLMGMMTTRYGITAGAHNASEQRNKH